MKQNWIKERQSKIGASEIYSLIFNYEIQANPEEFFNRFTGLNRRVIEKEPPFQTATEIFLNKKYNISNQINPIDSKFGNIMEDYILSKINDKVSIEIKSKNINEDGSYNLIVNNDFNSKACATPDGIIKIKNEFQTENGEIANNVDAVLEIKTARLDTTSEEAKLQYLFQLQQQMAVSNLDYGMIVVMQPNTFEKTTIQGVDYDYQDLKVRIITMHEYDLNQDIEDLIDQHFDIKIFYYKKDNYIINMISNCINKFWQDFDNNNLPFLSTKDNFLSANKIKNTNTEIRNIVKQFKAVYGNNGGDNLELEGFDDLQNKLDRFKELEKQIELDKNTILTFSYNEIIKAYQQNKQINRITFGKNGKLQDNFFIKI